MSSRQIKVNTNSSQADSMEAFKKYLNLIWIKKLWIILITLVFTFFWLFVYSAFLKPINEYTAYAIIKFDNPQYDRNLNAITDFAQTQADAKIALLQTRSFMEKVVDSLKLNIVLNTPGIDRFNFIKKVSFNNNARLGDYKLYININKIDVYYSNRIEKIKNVKIETKYFENDSVMDLSFNGINLKLNSLILRQYKDIEFSYLEKLIVINIIRSNLVLQLDRSRTILTLGYKSVSPKTAAIITNTIADFFVGQLLEFKKYTTKSVLKSFEEQLVLARRELDKSENELRRFREKNPYLMLSDAGNNIVTQLSTQQSTLSSLESNVERLSSMVNQKNNGGYRDLNLYYSEILSLLEEQNAPGINVLADKYRELTDNKNRLLAQNYSNQHPQIIDIDTNIKTLQVEIDNRVTNFLNQLIVSRDGIQKTITLNQQDLQKLPSGELRLAELQRDRTVKENIYSNILIRYNEAKISDAAIMPDAFLIEEAEPPTFETTKISKKIKKLVVGPFFGLFLGIMFFILLDFLDKTVKSSREVETKLNLPVIANIPIIGNEKEIPSEIDIERKMDSRLITSDYAPHIAGESFRMLRTKVMMQIQNENRAFLVASLNPNEGKSLIASNLAITFAQQKIPTVIIDCDLRRGVLHNSFACHKKPGLTDILVGDSPIKLTEVSELIQKTHIPNLFLMSNGTQVPNPSELLGTNRMRSLIEIFRNDFGAIILDTPPIAFITDALILNNIVHGIVFIVRYNKTNLDKLHDKIKEFSMNTSDFLGVVINASEEVSQKSYSSYSYYHY